MLIYSSNKYYKMSNTSGSSPYILPKQLEMKLHTAPLRGPVSYSDQPAHLRSLISLHSAICKQTNLRLRWVPYSPVHVGNDVPRLNLQFQ